MTEPDRRQILREVYEENKRVQERRFHRPATVTTIAVGSFGLIAAVVVLLFAFGLITLGESDRPETSSLAVEQTGSPVEFRIPTASAGTPLELPPMTGDLSLLRDADVPLSELFDLDVRHVVIDPGHGGRDSGALGASGLFEKDITLDVSRRLARRLREEHGLTVTMTRTTDSTLTLRDRVRTANEAEGDLFVSVHVNYFPSEPVYALETYYFGAQSDEDALRLADLENRNSDYSVAEFNRMVSEFTGRVKLEESRRLAHYVQRSLVANTRELNGSVDDWGIKSAPFVVLLGSQAPGILCEIGVISNRDEEAKLATSEYREQLATFLEEGIVNYLGQLKHGGQEEE
ncbi:MAG: N-acetylmuramoyl-L-alanine amidase [Rhodothermales bacterium]|nr:N-acetylmuramoyl-L-alanine amidase [Rhodothermales bacterium]